MISHDLIPGSFPLKTEDLKSGKHSINESLFFQYFGQFLKNVRIAICFGNERNDFSKLGTNYYQLFVISRFQGTSGNLDCWRMMELSPQECQV
jgi:hypothetical protein